MSTFGQRTATKDAVLFLPRNVLPEKSFQPGQNRYLDRLYMRTDRIVTSARIDLANIFATYGLSRQNLLRTQRAIGNQAKSGSEPTPTEFWKTTAQPESERLQQAAIIRIDRCRDELASSIEQLANSLEHWPLAEDPDLPTGYGNDEHSFQQDLYRRALHSALRQVVAEFRTVVPDSEIDALGIWWQSKLQRAALTSTFGKSMLVSASRLVADAQAFEMELLNQPPWSHGDRLLLAFEIAHRDVREAVVSAEHSLGFGVMNLCDV